MHLSAETNHLLQKQFRQVLKPAQVAACALLCTVSFATAFVHSGFRGHPQLASFSQAGLATLLLLGAASTVLAITRYRVRAASRGWIGCALGIWSGLYAGVQQGNACWQNHGVPYNIWKEMASYVNIDPARDKGESFMDAGIVYFKEGSHIQRRQGTAFHNGRTYCVAPIMRQQGAALRDLPVPRNGTVDFWAVGTDCCGKSGEDFRCYDAESPLARSGLRQLDETSRSMYLLAVQQWSATTGLPVRHPLFFQWLKDPLTYQEQVEAQAWDEFVPQVLLSLIYASTAAFALHALLQKLRVS